MKQRKLGSFIKIIVVYNLNMKAKRSINEDELSLLSGAEIQTEISTTLLFEYKNNIISYNEH